MKKSARKLELNRETLRELRAGLLSEIRGGIVTDDADTAIIIVVDDMPPGRIVTDDSDTLS